MFNVRIGTGSFERLELLYDIQMPVVPGVGEFVTVRADGREIRYPVVAVEYLVDDKDFWGATVLVQDRGEAHADLSEAMTLEDDAEVVAGPFADPVPD